MEQYIDKGSEPLMIRFAVIGTNWITERFLDAAMAVEAFMLTTVYSRSEVTASAFAFKYGAKYTFTDLIELARSDAYDAVYLASPNAFHAEQAILLMDHGKHVLCEKPIASNVREFDQMVEAAQRNGVLLMEALKSTFLPNFSMIQQHLPRLGPVRRYLASFCQYSSRYDSYKQGTVLNAFNPLLSNGSLMDLGVYCLFPMIVLFGKPARIQASGWLLDSGVDGAGSVIVQYPEMDALIQHSKVTNSFLPAEIQGEEGTMVIERISQPSSVEIRYRDGSVERLTQPQHSNTMIYELQEFIKLIQEGRLESSINTYERSRMTLEITDEARRQIGLRYPADHTVI